MEQRVSMITLGVADMARARRFYEQGLGWRRANDQDEVAFYQIGGMVLGLYGREALAEDAQVPSSGSGFAGVVLAYNVRTREEVDQILQEAEAAGGRILKPAQDAFWGGYSGYFADPEDHLWEVAWNPYWMVAEDGTIDLSPGT